MYHVYKLESPMLRTKKCFHFGSRSNHFDMFDKLLLSFKVCISSTTNLSFGIRSNYFDNFDKLLSSKCNRVFKLCITLCYREKILNK